MSWRYFRLTVKILMFFFRLTPYLLSLKKRRNGKNNLLLYKQPFKINFHCLKKLKKIVIY